MCPSKVRFVGARAQNRPSCAGPGTSSRGSTHALCPGTGTSSRGSTHALCPGTGTSSRGSTRAPCQARALVSTGFRQCPLHLLSHKLLKHQLQICCRFPLSQDFFLVVCEHAWFRALACLKNVHFIALAPCPGTGTKSEWGLKSNKASS